MDTSMRHLGIMLICETCEGEVDLYDEDAPIQCRHCGIAFAIDVPDASASARRSA